MSSKPNSASATTNERGQVLVLFALFLVVLLGAAAIAVDYGSWLVVRRGYQNAADSAVLAGSAFLDRPISNPKRTQAREAAWTSLKAELGLSSAVDPVTLAGTNTPEGSPVLDSGFRLWVSTPPIGSASKYPGSYTGSADRYLFALVEKDNPTFFARIFGQGSANVGAWATAGSFSSRYAVITLRQQGQGPNFAPGDIDLDGTNSYLEVIDGDVGGNWGMKLTSSAELWLHGTGNNDADVYLIDYISCGQSCWGVGQINSGPNGSPPNQTKTAQPLPGIIDDPNYPLPGVLSPPPNGPVAAVPIGDDGDGPGGGANKPPGAIDVKSNGPGAAPGGATLVNNVLTCDPLSPRIGPGYYSEITVAAGTCLILDPTVRHTSVQANIVDVPTNVAQSQLPGIFYVNGPIDINNGAMIVGDGVTVIMRPHGNDSLTAAAGGVVDLNRGKTPGATAQKLGAWMRNGSPPYAWNGVNQWVYSSGLEANADNVGIALYIIKREQYSNVATDDNTSIIKINAGAALAWEGITYAPHDNVVFAGQPGHDAVGQLVSWTLKFAGGVPVKQRYSGPSESLPRLVEPRLGQ